MMLKYGERYATRRAFRELGDEPGKPVPLREVVLKRGDMHEGRWGWVTITLPNGQDVPIDRSHLLPLGTTGRFELNTIGVGKEGPETDALVVDGDRYSFGITDIIREAGGCVEDENTVHHFGDPVLWDDGTDGGDLRRLGQGEQPDLPAGHAHQDHRRG